LSNNRAPLAGSGNNAGDDSVVTIRVKDQNGEETMFKVKTSTRFGKIMHTYAIRKGVEVDSLRFLLDAERIGPNYTCAELGLEDEDQVDVILAQVGC
jgi:small ubiquitin-related modifier